MSKTEELVALEWDVGDTLKCIPYHTDVDETHCAYIDVQCEFIVFRGKTKDDPSWVYETRDGEVYAPWDLYPCSYPEVKFR